VTKPTLVLVITRACMQHFTRQYKELFKLIDDCYVILFHVIRVYVYQ